MIEVKEGDVLEWNAVNGPKRGYAVMTGGDIAVFVDDEHSFALDDLIRTPSLRVVGKVRIR